MKSISSNNFLSLIARHLSDPLHVDFTQLTQGITPDEAENLLKCNLEYDFLQLNLSEEKQ